jgi:iron complex outermembrane receptor protein
MTYFVYSQGFKSGGFQFAKFNAVEAREVFDPETVETFEVGVKSSWFDHRLRLNMNYFYYDYTDLQVAKTTTGASGAPAISTLNAASATVQGFELDGSLGLSEELTLNIGYAYLDATYDEYIFNAAVDFSGNDLVRSPKNTFNVTLDYSTPVADGIFSLRGDFSWVGKHFFEPDQGLTFGTTQNNYSLLNVSAAYEKGPWRVSVWGKNLTDEIYRTTTLSFGAFTMEYLNLPRTYGVTLGWTYN